MCEFCTKHGDGQIWYRNAANYSQDLLSDLKRRSFIDNFLESTFHEGYATLGRLEALFRKKGQIPGRIKRAMEDRARDEHFGQVLPIEEIRDIVLRARTVVRMPCACRWTAEKKESRCCYGVSYGAEAWYEGIDMSYFGMAAHEGLESLLPGEAVSQMEELGEKGSIHTIWTMVTPFIGAICNCTVKDCTALKMLTGIGVETLMSAELAAVVDRDLCTGCGACDAWCQFGAIGTEFRGGVYLAKIDGTKCLGCGLCRRGCEAQAISLVPRRPE